MDKYTDLHADEQINQPTPPEHEATDDCRNPSNHDECDYSEDKAS